MMYVIVLLALVTCNCPTCCSAYQQGIPSPIVNRKALAGLWRLTPSVLSIKEFTVHPRKPPKDPPEELLLLLKEDGSFTRYDDDTARATCSHMDDDGEDEEDDSTTAAAPTTPNLDQSWKQYVTDKRNNKTEQPIKTLFKGTWDYRDGSLILAADRDEQRAKSDNYQTTTTTTTSSSTADLPPKATTMAKNLFWRQGKDTILVGAVVVTQTMMDTPIVPREEQVPLNHNSNQQQHTNNNNNNNHQNGTRTAAANTATTTNAPQKLSVPMGSVQVGKFFYPKNHPSFFDQPMYQPRRFGTFQLQQVLGGLTSITKDDDALVEKFRNQDFHNKRFFLTSHPIEQRKRPNKSSYDEDTPFIKKNAEQKSHRPNMMIPSIRVMKVMIHANNTFSTIAGLGDTTILRGRFSVIGDQRDQVWMQSLRFGFGRSVSGSTFSEGNALGEETKSYWGKISYEDEDKEEGDTTNSPGGSPMASVQDDDNSNNKDEKPTTSRRLQVKGSVIVGWGLEPQPVARFVMREAVDDAEFFEDDNDEEEEEGEDNDNDEDGNDDKRSQGNGGDWSNTNAFQ